MKKKLEPVNIKEGQVFYYSNQKLHYIGPAIGDNDKVHVFWVFNKQKHRRDYMTFQDEVLRYLIRFFKKPNYYKGLKELPFGEHTCPHCGEDISEHITSMGAALEDIDVHLVQHETYGTFYEWKTVYKCPHCGKKFYEVCQH